MAVSITSTSGSWVHNGSITISGTGFGTKSPAAPDLWDAVDNISAYSGVADGATIPTGGGYPWGYNSYLQPGAVKMERTDTMRTSLRTACYKGTGVNPTLENRTLTGATELYIAWWTKFNVNTGAGSHSSKYLRLSGEGAHENGSVKTFSLTQAQIYGYGPPYCGPGDTTSWNGVVCQANTWHLIEVWANQNLRLFSVWQDGVSQEENFAQTNCSTWNWDYVWRVGWDGGGTSPPSVTMHLGEIYVDKTRSRVIVASGSTWTNRGHSELQIPTAWSSTNITVTVNRGSFGSTDSAYLYVVDSAGLVNANGHSITFGGGSSPPVGTVVLSVT